MAVSGGITSGSTFAALDLLHHPADGHFLELSADGRHGLQGKSDTDLDRFLYRVDAFCRGGDHAGLPASFAL